MLNLCSTLMHKILRFRNYTRKYLAKFVLYFFMFRLWFDELMGLWVSVQNLPSWEGVSICI